MAVAQQLEARALLAAFGAGNVVVYRVGTGSGALVNTGNAVFLDEYSPGGSLVQSLALPVTDPDGMLLGVVSIGDLNAWALDHQEITIHHLQEYLYGQY